MCKTIISAGITMFIIRGVFQVDRCGGPHVPRVCLIITGQRRLLGFLTTALELVMPKQQRILVFTFFEPLWDTFLFLKIFLPVWGRRGQFWNIEVFFWPIVWLNTTMFDFLVWNKVIFWNELAEWSVWVGLTLKSVIELADPWVPPTRIFYMDDSLLVQIIQINSKFFK